MAPHTPIQYKVEGYEYSILDTLQLKISINYKLSVKEELTLADTDMVSKACWQMSCKD